MAEAAAAPPGWDHNPSAWSERWHVAGHAAAGLAIAIYLTLYQVRALGSVWEPFFGDGSVRVLHSAFSRALPVPDALLGALGYLTEIVGALAGRADRWRAQPWVVVAFGAVVAAMAAVSLALVILQAAAFHAWCTLCLVSAAVSLTLVVPAGDEVVAAWRELARRRRA